jgi:hypothetical protein
MMKKLVLLAFVLMLIPGVLTAQVNRTMVLSCDGLGNVVATWDPPGPPLNGDPN